MNFFWGVEGVGVWFGVWVSVDGLAGQGLTSKSLLGCSG